MDINDMLRRHTPEFVLLELRDQLAKETARADRAVEALRSMAQHRDAAIEARDRLRAKINSRACANSSHCGME